MLHAGCGVGGHLAADLEFADGVVCRDGSVSDVTWRENSRCEPKSSLTVTLSARCRRNERPHHSATLGKLRQCSTTLRNAPCRFGDAGTDPISLLIFSGGSSICQGGQWPLASIPPGMPGTHPHQYFGWGNMNQNIPQYYYIA